MSFVLFKKCLFVEMKKTSLILSILLLLFAGGVWALEPCPENQPEEKWDNCTGTYTYESGAKYVSFRDLFKLNNIGSIITL